MPVDLGPKPRLGYTHNRLERAAELRTDAAALAALAGDPRAGAYVIGGDLIVLKKTSPLNDPLFTPAEAAAIGAATETVFLGHLNGAARFGFGIPQTAAEALKARDDLLSPTCARSRCTAWSIPTICRRSRRGRRCCIGTYVIVSVRTAARRPKPSTAAGGATAPTARPSISRAPIRW